MNKPYGVIKVRKPLLLSLIVVALLGCAEPKPVSLEFRIAEDEAAPGLTEMTVEQSGEHLFLHDEVLLNETHVQSAAVSPLDGGFAIEVKLTYDGAGVFEQLTEVNTGKLCAMVVDGRLVSAPRIMETIRGGRAVITGDFTEAEALRIANGLSQR